MVACGGVLHRILHRVRSWRVGLHHSDADRPSRDGGIVDRPPFNFGEYPQGEERAIQIGKRQATQRPAHDDDRFGLPDGAPTSAQQFLEGPTGIFPTSSRT